MTVEDLQEALALRPIWTSQCEEWHDTSNEHISDELVEEYLRGLVKKFEAFKADYEKTLKFHEEKELAYAKLVAAQAEDYAMKMREFDGMVHVPMSESFDVLLNKAKTRLELSREMERFWQNLYKEPDIKAAAQRFIEKKFVSVDDVRGFVEAQLKQAEASKEQFSKNMTEYNLKDFQNLQGWDLSKVREDHVDSWMDIFREITEAGFVLICKKGLEDNEKP